MLSKQLAALAIAAGLLSLSGPGAAREQVSRTSVLGRWLTDDRSGVVEIAPCGSAVCGTLVKVLDPAAPQNDINNPDPAKRGNTLVGVKVLTGLKRSGERWDDGKAYDPKAGRTYRAKIALASPDRLDVTGCVLFVCRTKHWTRVGKD